MHLPSAACSSPSLRLIKKHIQNLDFGKEKALGIELLRYRGFIYTEIDSHHLLACYLLNGWTKRKGVFMATDVLGEFMKQLSYEMGLDGAVEAEMSGVYLLPLGEGLQVVISLEEGRLSFTAELCDCPTIKREQFLQEMMYGNLFGQGTADALLGLTKDGKKLTLARHVEHAVNYEQFSELLQDFIDIIDFWVDQAKNYQ